MAVWRKTGVLRKTTWVSRTRWTLKCRPPPPLPQHQGRANSQQNLERLMCREWSPEEDSTMSLLQPVETALRNSRYNCFSWKNALKLKFQVCSWSVHDQPDEGVRKPRLHSPPTRWHRAQAHYQGQFEKSVTNKILDNIVFKYIIKVVRLFCPKMGTLID